MSKKTWSKRKLGTSIVAVVMTALLIFGGTFAWQSISQEALNEVAATVNPGGRLHDDFNNVSFETNPETNAPYDTMTYNKDVYVENFTSRLTNGINVYARVRLDVYMEIGDDAGVPNPDGTFLKDATSVVPGAKLEDKSTWTTHIFQDEEDPFKDYWVWDFEGSTIYMPTFNMNKDSLQADINGTYAENFSDYKEYTLDQAEADADPDDNIFYSVEETAIYDADTDNEDEVGEIVAADLPNHVTWGNIRTETETHTAKSTLNSTVISMADWQALPEDQQIGNYWVYDVDGWAYWANPIAPDTATGLLLDQIKRTETDINEDWYYGINVVAQFITADDMGQDDNTGFFDLSAGKAPTTEALQLLDKIGVEMYHKVDSAAALQEALEIGGTVELTKNIELTEGLTITDDTVLKLGNYTISNNEKIFVDGVEEDVWSLISVTGADTTLTIEAGEAGENGETGGFKALADDCFAIDVRDGAKVVINGGTFVGNITAVYVHEGSAAIYGGTFSIQQLNEGADGPYAQVINAYDPNFTEDKAAITICGGSFYGFNPSDANDGNLVPHGYEVSHDASTGSDIYTVTATTTATTPTETTPVTDPTESTGE